MSRNLEPWTRSGSGRRQSAELAKPFYSPPSRSIDSRPENTEWLRGVDILRKRWRLSALFALVVVVSVTVATLMMKPVYEPEARLEVDPPGAEVFSLQGNNNSGASTDYLETQAQNLQSDELALEVIRKLHLDQNPDFGANPKAMRGAPSHANEVAVPLTPAENKALFVFQQSRKITRDAASRLISVGMAAHDPLLAAAVTNTLVNMFIERDYELRNSAISQSSHWLQRQLDDIRQRMDDSNRALTEFEKDKGISTIGDNQNRFSDEMLELSRQLMQAQADRIQLESYLSQGGARKSPLEGKSQVQDDQTLRDDRARLADLRRQVADLSPAVPPDNYKLQQLQKQIANLEQQPLNQRAETSLPQISSNPVVQELTKRQAEVKADLAQTRTIYGENHPNTKKLENEAAELQSQLGEQRGEILGDLKTSYTAAQAREHLMQSQMQGASKQMIVLAQYNALKKEADANVQLYEALYQKIKEAAIAAATKSSNIRVVDRARVLDRPTRPRRVRNIAVGLLAGILGGVILAFLRESMDTSIRTPEDMKRCLEVESVSVVPMISQSVRDARGRPWRRLLPAKPQQSPSVFQVDRPNSPEGEALRGLSVSLRLSRRNGGSPQVLLVVSPQPGEGKTTLSINLALTLARHGATCIVDADLRRQGVAPALNIVAEHGLRELLSGTMDVDQALVPASRFPNLSLLSSGSAPGEPGGLIASSAMSSLVDKLRQRFDFIVIDSPPILAFSDGRALSAVVDGIIMVGRCGVTSRESLKRAMELLRGVQSAPVIELVLNAAEYHDIDYGCYRKYGMTV
jgi:succinoglycan biosynthesis transport protein ExoP